MPRRSCDGGISVSLRKCLSPKAECLGKAERYTICNMQVGFVFNK